MSGKTNLEPGKQNLQKPPRKQTISKKMGEYRESLSEFWEEFKRIKYGVVGIVLLIIFLNIVIFEKFIIGFPEVNDRWGDISYWEDLPRSAAPAWVNWFTEEDGARQETLLSQGDNIKEINDRMKVQEASFEYNYIYDLAPNNINFRALARGIVNLQIDLVRPDGETIKLAQKSIRTKAGAKEVKISLANESVYNVINFASKYISKAETDSLQRQLGTPFSALFVVGDERIVKDPQALKGTYQLKLKAAVMGEDAYLKDMNMVVAGQVFGILGTDSQKRDIWSGVIAGTKWAMLIGLMISFISVTVAVIYGVTSAYFGGWVDSLLMRIWEVFISMPMIPVLIVVAAVWKPSIWTMIIMMGAFYWRASVKTIRSMGLQIKEETYIEAARALDASNLRIIFKHMIPQLIPYAFASMALMVPIAIVAEATLSLLGLGDSTVVTWGQILQEANNGGAVLQGIWWWIVPPGLFIAVMGMTFAFIGFAMDTILNPKLKTR